MTKPVPQWQVPNQLNVHAITGTAETLSVPKPGLMNYFPKDRPKIGLGPLTDVSQYMEPLAPESAFDQLLEVPQHAFTPAPPRQNLETAQKRLDSQYERSFWATWGGSLPFGQFPPNIGDTQTVDTQKPQEDPKKPPPWVGPIVRPGIPDVPPVEPPAPPPPRQKSEILDFPHWGYALSFKVSKRKKRFLRQSKTIRPKNNGFQRSYRRQTGTPRRSSDPRYLFGGL